MSVRYEGDALEPDLELADVLQDDTSKALLYAVKTTLLSWNRLNPVSNWERNRNQIIYDNYQHNKNPFIDYPELAEYIWGDSIGVVWMPASTVAIREELSLEFSVYPNPSDGIIHIRAQVLADEVTVYNAQGRLMFRYIPETPSVSIDLQVIGAGIYIIEIDYAELVVRK